MMQKMFKGKKGMIFNIALVVLLIVVLTYGYIRLSEKTDVSRQIGAEPLNVVSRMQDGEKALIFLDFASKLAVYQAIYDFQASGGIVDSSACGSYYDFNMWNTVSGDTCFVDSNTAKDSLRDLFTSSLVSRLAAYPDADFIGSLSSAASSRGSALALGGLSGRIDKPKESVCGAGDEIQKDFSYESSSGFFPADGARLWMPKEANCGGSYPLVVFLHGCVRRSIAKVHTGFGDGSTSDIVPVARRVISSGYVTPVILAAPSQTIGTATFNGEPNSPCGDSLWGREFDPVAFVELVKSNLPEGTSISSVSFVGHSGAGCSINRGIHNAARSMSLFGVGQFDTCSGAVYGRSLVKSIPENGFFMAVYGTMGKNRAEQDDIMSIDNKIVCPSTEVSGGELSACLSGESNRYFSYGMKVNNHLVAVSVGMEQFLKEFFAKSQVSGGQ